MGNPFTGEIYEGALRDPDDVPLTHEQAERLRMMDSEKRLAELQKMHGEIRAHEAQTPAEADRTNLRADTDDLTSIRTIIHEMVKGLSTGRKSRERSLVITKLEEAGMWAVQAQAKEPL